jgi:hypothetical protein
MVIIRFPSVEVRRRALAYLLGRYSGRSWASGEVLVPETALAALAAEGIAFTVDGPATYDRILRLNQSAAPTSAHEAAETT